MRHFFLLPPPPPPPTLASRLRSRGGYSRSSAYPLPILSLSDRSHCLPLRFRLIHSIRLTVDSPPFDTPVAAAERRLFSSSCSSCSSSSSSSPRPVRARRPRRERREPSRGGPALSMASVSPLIYCSLYAGSMRTNQPPPTGRHVVPDDRKERNASSVPRCGLSSGPSAAFASALGRDLFRYRAGPAPRMIHTSTSSISARYSSSLLPPVQAVLVDASDNGKGLSAACDALKVFVIERERERERERGGGRRGEE